MITEIPFPLLIAAGPAPDHSDKLMAFGRLTGQWEFTGQQYNDNGSRTTGRGEIQIGWILGGRALQDVWIETGVSEGHPDMFGTTVRFYDPKIDAWRSVWSNPNTGTMRTFIGHAMPDGIAFEATDNSGKPIRWVFSEISEKSFRWHAEREIALGDWHTDEELRAVQKPNRQS